MKSLLEKKEMYESLTREELEEEMTWTDERGRLRDHKGRFVQEYESLVAGSLSDWDRIRFLPDKEGSPFTLYRTRILTEGEKILAFLGALGAIGLIRHFISFLSGL